MDTIKGAKLCPSAFHLETHRTPRMTRCSANRLPFKIRDKACVCGTPLFFKITEPVSNCCSHNPLHTRVFKKKTTRSACGCIVVVVVMVSAVVVLCVFCGCYVSIVMCPLLFVQCECLAVDHTRFVVFHPLTSFEVKTRTIFLGHAIF